MNYKLLYIEDDQDLAESVAVALSDFCDVDCASTLKAAENLLAQKNYQLVLCDKFLPDGDGMYFCIEIKDRYPQMAVLYTTGDTDIESKISGLASGALDYLIKPFDLRELRIRIKKGLESQLTTR